MYKSEAESILRGPLKFGDARQIEALEWLGLFAKGRDLDSQCHECNGTGTCTCLSCENEHNCGVCDGTGNFGLAETQDYSLKQLRELVKEMEEAAA